MHMLEALHLLISNKVAAYHVPYSRMIHTPLSKEGMERQSRDTSSVNQSFHYLKDLPILSQSITPSNFSPRAITVQKQTLLEKKINLFNKIMVDVSISTCNKLSQLSSTCALKVGWGIDQSTRSGKKKDQITHPLALMHSITM